MNTYNRFRSRIFHDELNVCHDSGTLNEVMLSEFRKNDQNIFSSKLKLKNFLKRIIIPFRPSDLIGCFLNQIFVLCLKCLTRVCNSHLSGRYIVFFTTVEHPLADITNIISETYQVSFTGNWQSKPIIL